MGNHATSTMPMSLPLKNLLALMVDSNLSNAVRNGVDLSCNMSLLALLVRRIVQDSFYLLPATALLFRRLDEKVWVWWFLQYIQQLHQTQTAHNHYPLSTEALVRVAIATKKTTQACCLNQCSLLRKARFLLLEVPLLFAQKDIS